MASEPQSSWHDGPSSRPPLHALFLVRFDVRKGSTIVWKRTHGDSLELDSSVEYKSLPSGLHTVEQDLIYFLHQDHAGLCAFENTPAQAAQRNASFFGLGVLSPLDGSRLGKVWLYANELQVLAFKLRASLLTSTPEASTDISADVQHELDDFWAKHHERQQPADEQAPHSTPDRTQSKRRPRALTEPAILGISDFHPASSIIALLDAFGPLIFPLHRAALLRQSILLIQRPPLRPACDYVYLLSVLTNLPNSVAEELPDVPARLDPLFAVGTYDMTDLIDRQASSETGWVACSSDELLATKTNLYDIKVEFPGSTVKYDESNTWPAIKTRNDEPVKATHRDVRRYKALRRRLYSLIHDDEGDEAVIESDGAPLLNNEASQEPGDWTIPDESAIVEPLPWAAIAYDSFLWWASAGERSTDLEEQDHHDNELLDAAFAANPDTPMPLSSRWPMTTGGRASSNQPIEMSIVTYFQRITTSIMSTVSRLVKDDADEPKLFLGKPDLLLMGLDIWSKDDQRFVEDLVRISFGIDADVQGANIECCGIRLL